MCELPIKYTSFYLARYGKLSDQSFLTGEVLEEYFHTCKVKWSNGEVRIENYTDLDMPIPFKEYRIISMETLEIIEVKKLIDGEWVSVPIPKKIEYRRAVTEQEKEKIKKAPEMIRSLHDKRGLTEYEWKLI